MARFITKLCLIGLTLHVSPRAQGQTQASNSSGRIVAIQAAQIAKLKSELDSVRKDLIASQRNPLSGFIQEVRNDEFIQILDNTQMSAAGTFLLTVTTRSSSVPGRGKVAQFAISTHIASGSAGAVISVHGLGGEGGGADFSTAATPSEYNISAKIWNQPGGTWKLLVGHQHGEIQSLGYKIEAYSR